MKKISEKNQENQEKIEVKVDAKIKSGVKTSEMWITVGAIVLNAVLAVLGIVNPALALKIIGILSTIYTIGRVAVKLTSSKIDDKIMEKLAEILKKNKANVVSKKK